MPADVEDGVELESGPAGETDVGLLLAHRAPASTRRHELLRTGRRDDRNHRHRRKPTEAMLNSIRTWTCSPKLDRKILASVLMNVDVTEVYSPIRVSELAAKFGLVPGSSLDLTNGWDFEE